MPGADNGELTLSVPISLAGERLDRALAMVSGLSRSRAAATIARGSVVVDDVVVTDRSRILQAGQRLVAGIAEDAVDLPRADPDVAFGVVYEDEDVVVVDKPAGLVVHPGAGHPHGTLVDGLLARYPEMAELPQQDLGDVHRPGIVHRLDKGTSGLLVVGRSPRGFVALRDQMTTHRAIRSYLALVHGWLEEDSGVIDAPIGRSTRDATRMAIKSSGRPAVSRYEVRRRLGASPGTSLVAVTLETGRTHQIRVHFAAIGHPVVGDHRYGAPGGRAARRRTPVLGGSVVSEGRIFLHAAHLAFEHPNGDVMELDCPLPADLSEALAAYDKD